MVDEKEITVAIAAELTLDELADQILWDTTEEEMIALVKRLDEISGSWQFSETMYKHFKKQHKKFKKEKKELDW